MWVRASERIKCKKNMRCDKCGMLKLHEGREKEGIIREKETTYLTRGNLHELKRESAKRFECAGGCELKMRSKGKRRGVSERYERWDEYVDVVGKGESDHWAFERTIKTNEAMLQWAAS